MLDQFNVYAYNYFSNMTFGGIRDPSKFLLLLSLAIKLYRAKLLSMIKKIKYTGISFTKSIFNQAVSIKVSSKQ